MHTYIYTCKVNVNRIGRGKVKWLIGKNRVSETGGKLLSMSINSHILISIGHLILQDSTKSICSNILFVFISSILFVVVIVLLVRHLLEQWLLLLLSLMRCQCHFLQNVFKTFLEKYAHHAHQDYYAMAFAAIHSPLSHRDIETISFTCRVNKMV